MEINLFLAYCSDSVDLMNIAKKVIEEINTYLSGFLNAKINYKEWKQDTYAAMGNPESSILEQMPPNKCSIFIGIFRYKYGSPTGNINIDTNTKYLSGSEEEFCTAYRLWQQYQTPHIMIFKSTEPIPRKYLDFEQINNLNMYFKEFKPEGRYPGTYCEFDNIETFENEFRRNMILLLKKLLNNKEHTYNQTPYFDKVFNSNNSTERFNDKQSEIRRSKSLKLFAKTGNSFLAQKHNFNTDLYKTLKEGGIFKAIILNPWSLNAIYTAFCEEVNYSYIKGNVLHELLSDKLDGKKVVDIFVNSRWYEKFRNCIGGYQDLLKINKKSIQLRLTNIDAESSIFLTENCCFFEPYVNSMTYGRNNVFPLFEVIINNNDPKYKYFESYFDSLWNTACKYNDFVNKEDYYKNQIINYFDYKNLYGKKNK